MKDFWKKHKIVLVITAFLLVVPFLFYQLAISSIGKIRSKADLVQEKIIDSNLEKSKIDKILEMEIANADFEKNKLAVGTILSSSSKVNFIEYVEALAAETNNKIELKVLEDSNVENKTVTKAKTKTVPADKDGDNPSEKVDKKSIEDSLVYKQYISMQIDLEGDYSEFLNFVHKLENNKYYVNIISFNMQKVFIKKEDASEKSSAIPGGIFLSPVSREANNGLGLKTDQVGDPLLKSTLKIIVYTE